MQLLLGCFCVNLLCISLLHLLSLLIIYLTPISLSLSLSLTLLSYGLHVVSLGHCSACLPQIIGHGWLTNRSYTTLKRQKVPTTRGQSAIICLRVCVSYAAFTDIMKFPSTLRLKGTLLCARTHTHTNRHLRYG